MKSLEVLDLEHNKICGNIPPALCKCEAVEALYLGHNRLVGPIPWNLGGLWRLVDLNLNGNTLTGFVRAKNAAFVLTYMFVVLFRPIPPSVGNLTNLRGLAIDDNCLSGSLPIAQLRCLSKLRVLHLHNNDFVGGVDIEPASTSPNPCDNSTDLITPTSPNEKLPPSSAGLVEPATRASLEVLIVEVPLMSLREVERCLREALPECTVVIDVTPSVCCVLQ